MVMLDGIQHFGDLIRRIRERRQLSQAEVALRGNLKSDRPAISKLENEGTGVSLNTVAKILRGLGLDNDDRELLLQRLYLSSQLVEDRERDLCKYRFTTVKQEANGAFRAALERIQTCTYPAFLRDELWFVPVFSQSILDLFKVTEGDLRESPWLAWHVIGAKYADGSKVAKAHGDKAEMYFPQAVKNFFEETGKYFFTTQMRALRNHLWPLSHDFQEWWNATTGFTVPFKKLKYLPREILYEGEWISLEVREEEIPVYLADGPCLKYRMVYWYPCGTDAKLVIQQVSKPSIHQPVYFAADYIEDYNNWAEVKEEVYGCGDS